ncbi:hypothetical protein BBJ29_010003 [Phytophthora kernoviae]|uniref:Uncharacterized protein n=1 Tax=Phytophthora kernoviae TaxID=325452 RepID=A0A421FUU6_9STRA|nr:hypothetical protein BBJ29_010003 [Phytophthora kernoviae]
MEEAARVEEPVPSDSEDAPVADSTSPAPPAEVLAALISAMKSKPKNTRLTAWVTTVRALFAEEHDKLQLNANLIPQSKRQYPKLTGTEATQLLTFVEIALVEDTGSYDDWVKFVAAMCRQLYNTNWSLTEIIRNMSGRARWTQTPVMNQWAEKVKGTSSKKSTGSDTGPIFKPFMFNPDVYTAVDIKRLSELCERPADERAGGRIREGTQDEWKIIAGLAEGNIACRRLPQLAKRILAPAERLRLYGTQSTKALVEAMLLAAETKKMAVEELHGMLNKVKTISYDRVTKSIHFFFFTRETAVDQGKILLPYRGRLYRLQNAHRKEDGAVWDRQVGADGIRGSPKAEYQILIHNITRFFDIGRFTAYLQRKIPLEFELEDLDGCTPHSRTSTT